MKTKELLYQTRMIHFATDMLLTEFPIKNITKMEWTTNSFGNASVAKTAMMLVKTNLMASNKNEKH